MKENKSFNNKLLYPYQFQVYDKCDNNKSKIDLPNIYSFERFDILKYQPVQGKITTSNSV